MYIYTYIYIYIDIYIYIYTRIYICAHVNIEVLDFPYDLLFLRFARRGVQPTC